MKKVPSVLGKDMTYPAKPGSSTECAQEPAEDGLKRDTSQSNVNDLTRSLSNPGLSLPENISAVNDSNALLFEIRITSDRGRGMFATSPIPLGKRILHEAPIITLPFPYWRPPDLHRAFSKLSSTQQETYLTLHSAHGQDSSHDPPFPLSTSNIDRIVAEEHRAAHNAPNRSLDSVFLTNCMPAGANSAGIYPTASRINHSCVPNAFFAWNEFLRQITVHAIRDISVGDEVLICYCDPFEGVAMRAEHLRRYGFICQCTACAAGPAMDLSEKNRHRLRVLSDETEERQQAGTHQTPDKVEELMRMLLEMVGLLIQEGLCMDDLGRL